MRQLIATDLAFFPERLHRMIVINAPWYFPALYNLFKPFIDPRTREKILILGTDFASSLEEYMELSQIPSDYGGEDMDVDWISSSFSEESGFSLAQMEAKQMKQLEYPHDCNFMLTPQEMTSLHHAFSHPKYRDDPRTITMRELLER